VDEERGEIAIKSLEENVEGADDDECAEDDVAEDTAESTMYEV